MELHKAIKSVIETDGQEIVKDVRLVNILSDFQAFDAIPASKYILRAVIADGYSQKLLAIGAWNSQSENLCNQFVATTGFQNDYAYMVFQSLAYGLGFLNQMPTMTNPVQQPPRNSSPQKPTQKLTKKEQKEAFLLSKVEFLNDIKAEIGVEMTNLSFEMFENSDRCFYFNFEIRGKIKNDDSNICIAFYDTKSKIRKKEDLWVVFQDGSFRGFSIESEFFELPMPIEEISRICIFLQ